MKMKTRAYRRRRGALWWILNRVGAVLGVAWVVATVVFFALRAAGGDPTEAILGGPGSQTSPEAMEAARREYGLDQPVVIQYVTMLRRIITLDLGDSYSRRQPVGSLIAAHFGPTLALTMLALAMAWVLALVGAVVAVRRGGVVARAVELSEVVASVLPHFWLGAVFITVFASQLGWVPATSTTNHPLHLVLPGLTLAIPLAGFLAQVMHDRLAQAHTSPFATTARTRGLSEVGVLVRHSLRHGVAPALALSGWAFGSLLSGAVIVETLFARPGLGRLLVEATQARDVPVVIGVVVVVAGAYVVIMTVTDVVERLVDPRTHSPALGVDA